jgi:hypothetical protein
MVQKQVAFEKTKQQQETLTLSDISPRWAERLGQRQERLGQRQERLGQRQERLGQRQELPIPMSITWLRWWFEIIWPPKCVVGEAYGFARSYTNCCSECGKLGDNFSLYFTLNLRSKLEENKQRFVKHWNKKHAHFQSRCTGT